MHFANCATLAAVLIAILNRKFETSFICRGWTVLNLFLNFEENWASCSYKIVLIKK